MNPDQLIQNLMDAARDVQVNNARIKSVDQANQILREANTVLAERVVELDSYRQRASGTIDELRAEINGLQDSKRSAECRVEELESYSAGAAKTIDALRAEIENRKESAELLEVRVHVLEAVVTNLTGANFELEERRARAIDHYRELLKSSAERGDALEAQVKELDGCLKNMREEHVRLMLESIRWKKEAADMKGNWELCIEACDRLKQRIYPQEKANYILKTNAQAAQNQVRDLQTATEAKELALAAQVAENSRLIGVITRLRQKLSEYWTADMEDQETFLAGLIKQTKDGC